MHEEFLHELISAYVDGEVSEDERRRAETLLSAHADLRQYHDELLLMRAGFQGLPRHQLPAEFPERILAKIGEHSAHSPPMAGRHSSAATTTSWRLALLAVGSLAAMILLSVQLGWFDRQGNTSPSDQGQVAQDDSIPPRGDDTIASSTPADADRSADHSEPSAEERPFPQADALAEARSPSGSATTSQSAAGQSPTGQSAAGQSATGQSEATRDGNVAEVASSEENGLPLASNSLPAAPPAADAALPGIMLVLDVILSSRGIAEGTFASSLERAEVPWMNHIPVDAGMEQSLLSSRFFGGVRADQLPLDPTPGTRPEDDSYLQLAFVVARGEQIVETIDQLVLARDVGEVVALRFDIAMGGNESELAVQLHRAMRSDGDPPAQTIRAHPLTIEPETQQRLLAALRRPSGRSQGAAPGAPDSRSTTEEVERDRDSSPSSELPIGAAHRQMFGGTTKFPILFVLRSEGQARSEEVRP
jgi:hypothetical protein